MMLTTTHAKVIWVISCWITCVDLFGRLVCNDFANRISWLMSVYFELQ